MHRASSKRHLSRLHRGGERIVEREPALINLPIPVPSIPLLNPLLAPLIAGPAAAATPKPSSTTPAQPVSSSSSSGSSSSGSSSNGGGSSGGESSGNAGGNSGSNSGGGSNNGSGGSDNSSGGSDGDSGGSSSTNTANSKTPTAASSPVNGSPASSSPFVSSFASHVDTLASPSATDVSSSSVSVAPQPVSHIATTPDGANGTDGSESESESESSAPAGVAISPAGTSSASPPILTTGTTQGSSGGVNGSDGGTGGGSTTSAGTTVTPSHALSGGAIGGIVVAVLLLISVLVIINMRRLARNRRTAHRMRWLTGAGYIGGENHQGSMTEPQRLRQSHRSSFGTPFSNSVVDGRLSPVFEHSRFVQPTLVPDLPPMAQIETRRPQPPALIVTISHEEVIATDGHRSSVSSTGSARSSSSFSSEAGQVLTVPEAAHGPDMPSTPMSVRPFSPSERFSFPKPPTTAGTERNSLSSAVSAKPPANPFADPLPMSPSAYAFEHGAAPVIGAPPMPSPATPATPNITTDPFDDPTPSKGKDAERPPAGSSVHSVVAGTLATVQRPFSPTRSDELKVIPGETVLALRAFDDGWVQVRNDGKETGLIPIDCFREMGEDVPAFLSSMRISSIFHYSALAL